MKLLVTLRISSALLATISRRSVVRIFFFLPRWARVSKLFILVGVIVGVILLASFDFLESTRQVNGFPLCPLGGDVCALVITGLRGVSIVCCSIFCVYEFLPPNAPICQLESCGAHAALQPVTLACCAKRKIFFQSFFLVSRPVQYLAAGLERRARLRRRTRVSLPRTPPSLSLSLSHLQLFATVYRERFLLLQRAIRADAGLFLLLLLLRLARVPVTILPELGCTRQSRR